jgi:ATP-binding cassette subfamily F protein uup
VGTGTFALEGGGRVGVYPGGYEDWLRQRPKPEPAAPNSGTGAPPVPPPMRRQDACATSLLRRSQTRLGFNERRERQELPGRIEALEREVAALHAALGDASLYRRDPAASAAAQARLPLAEAELEAAFERWAELEERAESGA